MALRGAPPPRESRGYWGSDYGRRSRRGSGPPGGWIFALVVGLVVVALYVRSGLTEPVENATATPLSTLTRSPAASLTASPSLAVIVSASPSPSPSATASPTPTASATSAPTETPVAVTPPPPTAPPTRDPNAFVGYRATYLAPTPATILTGVRAPVALTVTNAGTRVWGVTGETPVQASTHILDSQRTPVIAEGPRTNLPVVLPGDSATVTVFVDAPLLATDYILQFDLVIGDVWFSSLGSRPSEVRMRTESIARAGVQYRITSVSQSSPGSLMVTVTNAGPAGFGSTGRFPVLLSSHWLDLNGAAVLWDGPRMAIPYLEPGATGIVTLPLASPPSTTRQLAVDLVQEGIGWFGMATVRTVNVVP